MNPWTFGARDAKRLEGVAEGVDMNTLYTKRTPVYTTICAPTIDQQSMHTFTERAFEQVRTFTLVIWLTHTPVTC